MFPYTFLLIPLFVFLFSIGLLLWRVRRKRRLQQQQDFIRQYRFPPGLFAKMQQHLPQLDQASYHELCNGLRQFFLACSMAPGQNLEMPSHAVDLLWHEFILFTRSYEQFCSRAFGRFLHHAPAGSSSGVSQLMPSWLAACAAEKINPQQPERLPALFSLDSRLGMATPILWMLMAGSLQRTLPDGRLQQYSLASAANTGYYDAFSTSFDSSSCSADINCSDSSCSSDSGGSDSGSSCSSSCSGGGCSSSS